MRDLTLAALATVGTCANLSGQTGGWLIEVDGVVSPSNPSATVNVYAWFDYEPGVAEVFASGHLDLRAGEEGWVTAQCPIGMTFPPCGNFVQIRGATIELLRVGQIWLPGVIKPDPSNPILAVVAEWETTDFTPREVLVDTTRLANFNVYRSPGLTNAVDPIMPGRAVIRVVPAPGAAVVLALGGMLVSRRRRGIRAG